MIDSAAAWMQERRFADDGRGTALVRRAPGHVHERREAIRRREAPLLRRGVVESLI